MMIVNEYYLLGALNMKLFIIGATGGVGKAAVQQALNKGYEVTAYVRDKSKLAHITDNNLTLVQGDGLDLSAIKEAMKGHDGVICTVGTQGLKASTLMSDIVKNLIAAMKENQITKIVYCASAGIHKEIPGLMGKSIMFLLRNPLKDHSLSYQYLSESGLDYTVVRPMGLVDEDKIEPYQIVGDKVNPPSSKISRKAVAHFIVDAVGSDKYNKQSIGLSY